jgi:membrane-associated phospholipid phosphatase
MVHPLPAAPPQLPAAGAAPPAPPAADPSARPHPAAPPAPRAALGLAVAGGVGTLVVAALARPGEGGASSGSVDRVLRRAVRPSGQPHESQVARSSGWRGAVSTALGGLAGEAATLTAGALAAAAVGRRRGWRPALPVLAAVPAALGAHAALKYTLRRPRPRTARLTGKHTPSFPSGHAARGAAAAGVVGYLAVREAGAPAALVLPLAAGVAAVGGSARVYVERHWATDAVGGWGLGLAAAALAALWYERERDAARP